MKVRWPAFLLGLSLAAFAPGETRASREVPVRITERPEDELLLLGVRVGSSEVEVVLPAYSSPAGVLVPVRGLLSALGLAVELDPDRGWASTDWNQQRLTLDVARRELRAGGTVLICDSTVEVHRDDIFVPVPLMAAWTGLDLTVDRGASVVTVRSAKSLPVQEQAKRRSQEAQWHLAHPAWQADYPKLETGRRLFGFPFIDQTARSTSLRSQGSASNRWDYNTFLAGELLYLDADARLYGEKGRPLAEVAAGIGRREPEPVLLGPLAAREVRAGESFLPGLPLVTLPTSGTGALLSSFPLQRPSQFDRHTFRGRLPPGWDVELYRDQELIGLQTSRPDDTYEFEAPLTFGPNPFRLVFHGPHGERREESRPLYVGSQLNLPGEHHYRLAFTDPRGLGERAQLEADFSLAPRMSLALSAARVVLDDGAEVFGGAGLRGSYHRLFLTGDVAVDTSGGRAVEVGLQTLLGPLGLTVRQSALHRFRSEVFRPALAPITGRTTARVDGSLRLAGARPSLQGELLLDRHTDGSRAWQAANRVGVGLGRFALSHAMRRHQVEGASAPISSYVRNTLLISAHHRRWALRGAVEYDPRLPERPTDLSLTTEGPLWGGVFSVMGLDRNVQVDETRVLLSLRRAEGALGWSLRTEQGQRSGTSVSVAFTIGLNRDPRSGRWHAHASPVAARGAASAQVFLDMNGNGLRDRAEPPVEQARFLIGRALGTPATGSDGTAFLSALTGDPDVAVSLATASFEDPLWVVPQPGFRFVPRPGQTVLLDFPVRMTGDVSGTVMARDRAGSRPAPGLVLELVDARSGMVVRQTITAYDGFYEWAGVLPGRYQVQVATAGASRIGLRRPVTRAFSIPPEGGILDNIDLVMEIEGRPLAGDNEVPARPDQ